MKTVIWEDKNKVKHRSFITDDMEEKDAKNGYISDAPNVIDGIDWEEVARELQNALVDRGLFTYREMRDSQNGVSGAILKALKKRVIELYKRRK